MKDKDLKKMFLKETENIDISMSEKLKNTPIETSKQKKVSVKENEKATWLRLFLPISALACCLILAFTFIFPLNTSTNTSYLTAYVMEINPAIAIVADSEDNIINICSVNEDADEILSSAEFDDIIGKKLSLAVEKVIKVTSTEGILDGYTDKIRIFALNDNEKVLDKKLDRFGEMVRKELKEFGHEDIDFEKSPMKLDDFRDKMGFDDDFRKLDDMKKEIEEHDKYKGTTPPDKKPDDNPPVPPGEKEGDTPPPKPE